MNRILLVILCFAAVAMAAGCQKSLVGAERYREQARIDDELLQQYITDNNLQDVAQRVDTTGVYYIVVNAGTGNAVFTNSTRVTVGYKAKLLLTGQTVDSTANFHPSYTLGSGIIRAWQLGIPQVQKGGRVRILSPSRYAYGPYEQPNYGIPANSLLEFDITLYDVTN
ncbi:FKBP-type peptidyl-prolyl cis-trans isomerase [Mucilaginibacter sp. JRF]|uniref:FKBP-type peptidyl-prolyl cis-trans isomerase n=1 Tax=Mucilaginibacter sp. JRF TaxID=2780088 RepID=UPI00187F9B33|nr:FKBP-type peptidyl-prolyl cis-trans isomerase [Mucilaginibacter sp. JRF]MBE9585004.1 FKBP-type peptidyl-prolyl cis-trans isomerase [Mucilaginibacter sp. JRF]